ncbi:hypothetical protein VTN96DRAFT_3013 [Rasamsonia emersonii]
MAPEQAECATRRHVAEEKSERGSSVRNFSQKDSLSKVACQKFPSLSASKLLSAVPKEAKRRNTDLRSSLGVELVLVCG